jgi:signal peptidase II
MRLSVARWGFLIAALIFIADQLSKYWILEIIDLDSRRPIPILPVFSLTMVWNRGVSMGLLQADSDLGRWLLVALTAGIAVVVAIWLAKETSRLKALPLAMVLGGAIGNIVDRVRFGAVADFIHLHLGPYSFYVFNVADAAITLGVGLLLIQTLRGEKEIK